MYILEGASTVYNWCSQNGVLKTFGIIKTVLNLIRFAIPLILVFLTSIDIYKNVIDPSNKDGMKAIKNRIIAAIIVFFIPTIINFVMKIVNVGLSDNNNYSYNVSDCWVNGK